MAKYETLFIINPNATEEEAAAVTEKIKGVIETGGTVSEVSEWGKKKARIRNPEAARRLLCAYKIRCRRRNA